MSIKHITQGELKEVLEYCPDTGHFTWKINTGSVKVGKLAGNVNSRGYRALRYKGKAYLAHRLAFLYMLGEIPQQVDHIDLNKDNNIWDNLRPCTPKENCRNRIRKKSKTGIKNVFFEDNRYRVRLLVGGAMRNLGSYKDLELADLVACEARETYHGDFVRHSL